MKVVQIQSKSWVRDMNFSSCQQLQSKTQKQFHDYSHKYIDDFKFIVVNPPPEWTDQETGSTVTSFFPSYQDQSIENNTKIMLTHLLKSWYGNKSRAHPSAHALSPAEVVSLKEYYIELE